MLHWEEGRKERKGKGHGDKRGRSREQKGKEQIGGAGRRKIT